MSAPVITIDGPSGTGKGTVAKLLAQALGWHLLDSGAIYRAIAWAILQRQVDIDDLDTLKALLAVVDIQLIPNAFDQSVQVLCDNEDITTKIRTEQVSNMASKASAISMVREAVLDYQRQFRARPGLVTDGRDMGTVVFPDANLKIFLEASPEVRAERRYKQYLENNQEVTFFEVKQELMERDQRDRERETCPLQPASDAHLIDTSELNVAQVFAKTMDLVHQFVL